MDTKYLYIVRHCEATGQSRESELTEKGRVQALKLKEFFKDTEIDKIISSPYKRAIESIEPLAQERSMEIYIEEDLSERVLSTKDLPNWFQCLEESFKDFSLSFEGGESNYQAMDRVTKVVEKALTGIEQRILLVTHGNLLTLILKFFDENYGFEDWKQLTNPDVFQITINDNAMIKRIWND